MLALEQISVIMILREQKDKLLAGKRLVPLRWGCALPRPNAPGKAPNHIHTTLRWGMSTGYANAEKRWRLPTDHCEAKLSKRIVVPFSSCPQSLPVSQLFVRPLQTTTLARLGFPGALPQRRVVWMWFGAFPGAFGLGRAQPQRRGTSP